MRYWIYKGYENLLFYKIIINTSLSQVLHGLKTIIKYESNSDYRIRQLFNEYLTFIFKQTEFSRCFFFAINKNINSMVSRIMFAGGHVSK